MKKFVFTLLLLACCCFAAAPSSAAPGPTDTLKPVLNQLTGVLTDPSLKGDAHKATRRDKIRGIINEVFNSREMSSRILGPTWNQIGAAEQDNFAAQMTKFLENVYVGRLEEYSGERIQFTGELIRDNRAQVATEIQYQGKPVPLIYLMTNSDGRWTVFDINIEGLSLVNNYRDQFRSILRTDKYAGLIKMIEEKNREYAAGGGGK